MNDAELEALWKKLGNYTIDEDDCIEEPFLHFSKGTDRMDIWHWFDRNHSKGLIEGIVNKAEGRA